MEAIDYIGAPVERDVYIIHRTMITGYPVQGSIHIVLDDKRKKEAKDDQCNQDHEKDHPCPWLEKIAYILFTKFHVMNSGNACLSCSKTLPKNVKHRFYLFFSRYSIKEKDFRMIVPKLRNYLRVKGIRKSGSPGDLEKIPAEIQLLVNLIWCFYQSCCV